jgi:CO/xanthine dehydrogenase FAD-binding subunit
MKPPSFAYEAPEALDDALALLDRHGDDAKVLAGGQSLVPLLNFRLARPARLIDINGVPGLASISERDGTISIGAMTRQRTIETSPLVASRAPLLAAATRWIGHPPIRTRGTIGGSLAHNDPSGEYPAVLLALDAQVRIRSQRGERVLGIDAFLGEWLSTALGPDELVIAVEIPIGSKHATYGFAEVAKRHGDFALAGVAARFTLDGSHIGDARIVAFGGVARATRLTAAEDAIRGRVPNETLFGEANRAATAAIDPISDLHATGEYRRHLTGVLVVRALRQAFGEA